MTQTIRSTIAPPPVIKSKITKTGAVGPPGPRGDDGLTGPNEVTNETNTNLSGVLVADSGFVRTAEPDEVISREALQQAINEVLSSLLVAGSNINLSYDSDLRRWTISSTASASTWVIASGMWSDSGNWDDNATWSDS